MSTESVQAVQKAVETSTKFFRDIHAMYGTPEIFPCEQNVVGQWRYKAQEAEEIVTEAKSLTIPFDSIGDSVYLRHIVGSESGKLNARLKAFSIYFNVPQDLSKEKITAVITFNS